MNYMIFGLAIVAVATADVSHLLNGDESGYNYPEPQYDHEHHTQAPTYLPPVQAPQNDGQAPRPVNHLPIPQQEPAPFQHQSTYAPVSQETASHDQYEAATYLPPKSHSEHPHNDDPVTNDHAQYTTYPSIYPITTPAPDSTPAAVVFPELYVPPQDSSLDDVPIPVREPFIVLPTAESVPQFNNPTTVAPVTTPAEEAHHVEDSPAFNAAPVVETVAAPATVAPFVAPLPAPVSVAEPTKVAFEAPVFTPNAPAAVVAPAPFVAPVYAQTPIAPSAPVDASFVFPDSDIPVVAPSSIDVHVPLLDDGPIVFPDSKYNPAVPAASDPIATPTQIVVPAPVAAADPAPLFSLVPIAAPLPIIILIQYDASEPVDIQVLDDISNEHYIKLADPLPVQESTAAPVPTPRPFFQYSATVPHITTVADFITKPTQAPAVFADPQGPYVPAEEAVFAPVQAPVQEQPIISVAVPEQTVDDVPASHTYDDETGYNYKIPSVRF